MIPRYTRPEMGRIFSDENRFAQWLEVELAAAEALAETGDVPLEAARALRRHAACRSSIRVYGSQRACSSRVERGVALTIVDAQTDPGNGGV